MKVLVACEFSGVVREAFRRRGHDAWSVDLLPATDGSQFHIKGDALIAANHGQWDLMVAHPPCTYLASSGGRWFAERQVEQRQAVDFFLWIVSMPVSKIAVENPIGIMSSRYRKPDQIIQPWMFGHGETKATMPVVEGIA